MTSRLLKQPSAHHAYGNVIYVVSLLAMLVCTVGQFISVARPDNNYLDPHRLFLSIWQGNSPQQVWTERTGAFPGAHLWLSHPGQGDGIVDLGIVIGCASAAIAFLAAAGAYLRRPDRELGWAALCLFSAAIILTAMLGAIGISK